jgi:ribosome-associated heat shock protein Hsp15
LPAEHPVEQGQAAGARLDKWLWCVRFFRTRTAAARYCSEATLRVNRVQTNKPHHAVHVGDVLTFVLGAHVRVIRVTGLAKRRGSASVARMLYVDLAPPTPEKAIDTHAFGPD